MSVQHSKAQSLQKLREFCSQPPQGMISHWWFNGLVNAYPLHFLFYAQFSTSFQGTKKTARDKIKSSMTFRIEKILQYPVTEKDIVMFDRIMKEMDKRFDEKKSEHSN